MIDLVRAVVLKNYPEIAGKCGLNGIEMLRRHGLTPSMISDPERLVPLDDALNLLEDSAKRSGREAFGLLMAESRKISDYGAVSLLISHQRTLRDALLTTIEYGHLINRHVACSLEDVGEVSILRVEVMAETDVPKRQATELTLAIVFRVCASLMGARWNPLRVSFAHLPPAERTVHERLFRCKIEFDAEFTGIVCKAVDVDAPNPTADPDMATYARRFMESADSGQEDTFVFDVRKAIYLLMPLGRAKIEQAAQGLGISVRTMQRKLDESGTSFSAVLNSVRRELVVRYVGNSKYPLQRVCLMLGYTAPSSFTRWFLGEFGMPPQTWRHRRKKHA